jgi:hydrophobe/amphiphile efflux-3 (HAE3) family protein
MVRYIKFLLNFSRPALVLVAISAAVFAVFAARVPFDFSMEALFEADAPEAQDFLRFERLFGSDDNFVYLAFRAPDVLHPRTLRYVRELEAGLRRIPGVRRVFSPADAYVASVLTLRPRDAVLENPLLRGVLVSPDADAMAVVVEIAPELKRDAERAPVLAAIRREAERAERQMGTRIHIAGLPVVEEEYVRLIRRDLITFIPIAIAVFLLLLALYFRSFLGTFLPLVSCAVAIVWTLGLMTLLGLRIGVLTSIVPTLVLVIGISDAIHVLSRYQEDVRSAATKRDALATTVLIMTGVCFLTTFTSAIGFASLGLTSLPLVREFGLVTAGGLMLAYLAVMQVTTSVLDNAPPLRARVLDAFAQGWSDRIADAVAGLNHRYPAWIVAAMVLIAAASVAGMMRIHTRASWLQDIRADSPVRRAHEFMDENLGGVFSIDFLVRGDLRDPDVLRGIAQMEEFMRGLEGVGVIGPVEFLAAAGARDLPRSREEVERIVSGVRSMPAARPWLRAIVDEDLRHTRVTLRRPDLDSVELQRIVDAVLEWYAAAPRPFELIPTGKSYMAKRSLDRVMRDMLSSAGLAAACIFVTMALMFRSVLAGLLSMVPNLSPLVVTAGLMGWTGIPLNFSTATVFSISLGLAVDNTIHYLSRYRIEIARDGDHVAAMYRTMRGVARPMIFSSLLLILGFGAILTSNFRFTVQFGILGGATVLSALLADLFMTPLLMLLFRPRVRRWEGIEQRLAMLDRKIRQRVPLTEWERRLSGTDRPPD